MLARRLLFSLAVLGAAISFSPAAAASPEALGSLRSLEGEWRLVAVLAAEDDASVGDRAAAIDWARAGATFRALGDGNTELYASFAGPPLSQAGGVAGGSFAYRDAHSGTLQLRSELPAPMMRELERLDGALLPHAFVLAERARGAHFVYVRKVEIPASEVQRLVESAAASAERTVAASAE